MKHLCCICLEAPGKIPPWEMDDKNNPKQPLMCPKCIGAFARVKSHSGAYVQGLLEMLAWASKRARDAEHKRMAGKVKELEEKLRMDFNQEAEWLQECQLNIQSFDAEDKLTVESVNQILKVKK